jgi:hypothetical protein
MHMPDTDRNRRSRFFVTSGQSEAASAVEAKRPDQVADRECRRASADRLAGYFRPLAREVSRAGVWLGEAAVNFYQFPMR